jgi:ubiquinone/menaquinone biosynthesis C-methylase UbiE
MQIPVEQHYSREHLFENLLAALERSGINKNKVTRKDLAPLDEFHVRGTAVTIELAKNAGLHKDMKVLDVGCGIGGPCRLLADEYGCMATGIDITHEFIRTAALLSELTGLQDRTNFVHASALQLPFKANSFDMLWTQHVQMNIQDKKQFYAEINRVLKPDGTFVYYDIFSRNEEPITFPVPWADTSSISHLVTIDALHQLLTSAGFEITKITDQTPAGIIFLQTTLDKMENQGPPPTSVFMGASMPEKIGNLYKNLIEKKIVLESGICRKK